MGTWSWKPHLRSQTRGSIPSTTPQTLASQNLRGPPIIQTMEISLASPRHQASESGITALAFLLFFSVQVLYNGKLDSQWFGFGLVLEQKCWCSSPSEFLKNKTVEVCQDDPSVYLWHRKGQYMFSQFCFIGYFVILKLQRVVNICWEVTECQAFICSIWIVSFWSSKNLPR